MKPETLKITGLKYFISAVLLIISCRVALSQDVHFSMFNQSPLFLNPANTGNFTGNWRLSGIYRDQWRALNEPFTSAVIGFDKTFAVRNQRVSAGAFFLNDNSGGLGLSSNKLYFSAALQKKMGKNNILIGIQPGIVFRSYGNGNLTYPSDYDHDEGEFIISNTGDKRTYLDINMGAIWSSAFKIFEPEAGISLSHVNHPNESFFADESRLPLKFTVHGKLKTKLSDAIYVQPSLLLMNDNKAREMMYGSNIGYRIMKRRSNVKEIFAGVYLRDGYFSNSDAFSVIGGATINRLDIMVCYDLNVSGLKVATNNKGAFEVSFIYKSISTVLNSYSIPCERF